MPQTHRYRLLPPSEDDGSEKNYTGDCACQQRSPILVLKSTRLMGFLLFGLLLASNCCTWFFSRQIYREDSSNGATGRTPYARLERNIQVPVEGHNIYNNDDVAVRDQAWEDINADNGVIAVPVDYIAEKGLPDDSQIFPWDNSKKIYLTGGHHSLHCIQAIYFSLMDFWHERPQSQRWGHVVHCVDYIRQDVICNADDTPLYSSKDKSVPLGDGQNRLCRSWDKMDQWAKQYNACYSYINRTVSGNIPEIERYTFCPEGSPYIEAVEKVFGHIDPLP